ncbi:hypothetical protein [Blastopirellula marina]|uniref:Uncharacterized protein n=1 Tax=Blastopirellula marina DSM 3645 TaxID=314230 RepID=A3ZUH6_9BACT|nr:hypothetical protein [Blastopirellula marina]EAQ79886.1 hypothetical protein DSM3645_22139 [Blastopirellula marina DSM 3645]
MRPPASPALVEADQRRKEDDAEIQQAVEEAGYFTVFHPNEAGGV